MTYEEFLTKYDLTEEEADKFTASVLNHMMVSGKLCWMCESIEDWDYWFDQEKFGVLGEKGLDLWNLVDKKKMLSILNQQL